jgi:hypothetical protein
MMQDATAAQAGNRSAPRQDTAGPLVRLVYRSHSLLPGIGLAEQEAGLAEILRVARARNVALHVTGALVLYDDWFAQVLEGPEAAVMGLYDKIRRDPRHDRVVVDQSQTVDGRLFGNWAMALVAEHREPDVPLIATTGGLSQGAPWRVSAEQESVLTRLRDLTRGYGRGS